MRKIYKMTVPINAINPRTGIPPIKGFGQSAGTATDFKNFASIVNRERFDILFFELIRKPKGPEEYRVLMFWIQVDQIVCMLHLGENLFLRMLEFYFS